MTWMMYPDCFQDASMRRKREKACIGLLMDTPDIGGLESSSPLNDSSLSFVKKHLRYSWKEAILVKIDSVLITETDYMF
jgi:hypothetical protein